MKSTRLNDNSEKKKKKKKTSAFTSSKLHVLSNIYVENELQPF